MKRSIANRPGGSGVTHQQGNRSGTPHKPAGYAKKVDTPKSQRRTPPLPPTPALVDPVKTLGHPPRPRSARGRRWR